MERPSFNGIKSRPFGRGFICRFLLFVRITVTNNAPGTDVVERNIRVGQRRCDELLGSLRSSATYIGALKLKEFSKRTTFLRVNRQLNTSLENHE